MTAPRTPSPTSAAYRAAAHLEKSGALTPAELFAAVDCGSKPSNRLTMLEGALRTGWLIETLGKINIGYPAQLHFAQVEPPELSAKYIGQVAAPREPIVPLYERKPLSAKYRVSSAGFRDDVPAYSVRDQMRFATLGGRTL